MSLDIGTLENTRDSAKVSRGAIVESLNAVFEGRTIRAGTGFGQAFKRSDWHANDELMGECLGASYNGHTDVIQIVKRNGQPTGTLYAWVDGVETTFNQAPWTGRNAGPWAFAHSDQYIFAVNAVDGLWRKKIGDTSVTSWESLATTYATDLGGSATISLDRGDDYPLVAWNTGILTGAVATHAGYGTAYGPQSPSITTDGQLYMERTNDVSTQRLIEVPFDFTFSGSGGDFIENRYLYFEVEVQAVGGFGNDVRPEEDPFLKWQHWVAIYATDDNSKTFGTWAGWATPRVYLKLLDSSPVRPGEYIKIGVSVDLDHVAGVIDLAAVKKMGIVFWMQAANDYQVYVQQPRVGGTWMNKPTNSTYMDGNGFRNTSYAPSILPQLKDIEYATVNRRDSDGLESSATFSRIPASFGYGSPIVTGGLPLGAGVAWSLPGPDSGWDRTVLYRKRHSTNEWVAIAEATTTTTGIDYRVDASGDALSWGAIRTYSSAHYFGVQSAIVAGTCLEPAWGSLAVGVGAEVYVSYFEQPAKYVAPLRLKPQLFDTDDPLVGNTQYMDGQRTDRVLSLVYQDLLYAAGSRGIYVSIGDSAAEASAWRRLPLVEGAISRQAMCRFAGGVAVATRSGLYFVRASRAIARFADHDAVHQELTKNCRRSWERLLAGHATAPVVVMSFEEELFAFRGRRYLRMSKDGEFEEGQWLGTGFNQGEAGAPLAAGNFGTVTAFPIAEKRESSASPSTDYLPTALGVRSAVEPGWVQAAFVMDGRLFMVTNTGIIHELVRRDGVAFKHHAGTAIAGGALWGQLIDPNYSRIERVVIHTRGIEGTHVARVGAQSLDAQRGETSMWFNLTTLQTRHTSIFSRSGALHQAGVGFRSAKCEIVNLGLEMAGSSSGGQS